MKIPLFDIDWTLLAKDPEHNIHEKAFFYAFEHVYGIANAKRADVEGKLDNQIIIETLELNGVSKDKARLKLKEAMRAMIEYFKDHKEEGIIKVLPGVKKLLEILQKKNVPIGLLTGNVEEIGWAKLEQGGIRHYFQFGGFGDKGEKRVDLIEIARKNAEKVLKRELGERELVIIGDTPLDIACAKEGGIESIGVVSGPYSVSDLKKAGADLIVETLLDKEKILAFLGVQ